MRCVEEIERVWRCAAAGTLMIACWHACDIKGMRGRAEVRGGIVAYGNGAEVKKRWGKRGRRVEFGSILKLLPIMAVDEPL